MNRLSKQLYTCLLILITASFVTPVLNGENTRTKDIGIITFEDFSHPKAGIYHRNEEKPIFNHLKKAGLNPEWIKPEIFYKANREKCNTYKRIFIAFPAFAFSPEMYEGMTEYVKSGGLLIANNILSMIDTDDDSKIDFKKGDRHFPKPGFPTVGVHSPFIIRGTEMKVVEACPLTAGLPEKKSHEVKTRLYSRYIRTSTATPVVLAEGLYKEKRKHKNSPLVAFKHQGKGACIFLGMRIMFKDDWVIKIFNNTISNDTLEWLTAGEENE